MVVSKEGVAVGFLLIGNGRAGGNDTVKWDAVSRGWSGFLLRIEESPGFPDDAIQGRFFFDSTEVMGNGKGACKSEVDLGFVARWGDGHNGCYTPVLKSNRQKRMYSVQIKTLIALE